MVIMRENKELVFTAENSMWDIELLEKMALDGKLRVINEDIEVKDKEEIEKVFDEVRGRGYKEIEPISMEAAYELGLVTKDGVIVGVR